MSDSVAHSLNATYLGHQSWSISTTSTLVLVDPVLTESFGYQRDLRFSIYPERCVDISSIDSVHAVVLTNEHLDHFHLPSLRLLRRSVPIVLPAIAPRMVTEALRQSGFERIVRLADGARYDVDDIGIRLVGVAPSSPKWEHRVHSAHLFADNDPGILIQSDGELAYDRLEELGVRPRILVATNNAQIPCEPGDSAFANLLTDNAPAPMEGLRIVRAVIDEPASRMRSVDTVLLSGAGYTYDRKRSQLFRWNDPVALDGIVRKLSLNVHVVGLNPGQSLGPDGSVSWVPWIHKPESAQSPVECSEGSAPPERPRHLGSSTAGARDLIDRILEGLRWLEPLLINSTLGFAMVGANEYQGVLTGSRRLYLHLRGADDDYAAIEFDLNSSRFEQSNRSLREALFTIPFRIRRVRRRLP
ncbi:MAG: MBL fold metallo-hydrolase [Mycobacterium sp.]|nr:MBL fold metallo-hydrolase [Mycobacterium sp.]